MQQDHAKGQPTPLSLAIKKVSEVQLSCWVRSLHILKVFLYQGCYLQAVDRVKQLGCWLKRTPELWHKLGTWSASAVTFRIALRRLSLSTGARPVLRPDTDCDRAPGRLVITECAREKGAQTSRKGL